MQTSFRFLHTRNAIANEFKDWILKKRLLSDEVTIEKAGIVLNDARVKILILNRSIDFKNTIVKTICESLYKAIDNVVETKKKRKSIWYLETMRQDRLIGHFTSHLTFEKYKQYIFIKNAFQHTYHTFDFCKTFYKRSIRLKEADSYVKKKGGFFCYVSKYFLKIEISFQMLPEAFHSITNELINLMPQKKFQYRSFYFLTPSLTSLCRRL